MHILITRPLEVASILAQRLKTLGHNVTIDSLIKILPLEIVLPCLSSFQAVITTSQEAIRCLARLTPQRGFPLWCVGTESAKVAEILGFTQIHAGKGTAQELVAELLENTALPCYPFLHLSGDVIRLDLVKALLKMGIPAQRIIAYKTSEAACLSEETLKALKAKALKVVLFYSPRTAQLFDTLCRAAQASYYCRFVTAICLSPSISQEIQSLPWKKILIAKKNTTDDLLMTLIMAD